MLRLPARSFPFFSYFHFILFSVSVLEEKNITGIEENNMKLEFHIKENIWATTVK